MSVVQLQMIPQKIKKAKKHPYSQKSQGESQPWIVPVL